MVYGVEGGFSPTPSSSRKRWAWRSSDMNLSPSQWEGALNLLPPEDRTKIMRFVRMDDRKAALCSRLLQRALICDVFDIEWAAADVKRTAYWKPYFAGMDKVSAQLPGWNFNVSHQDGMVVIVSEPERMCGVDAVVTNDRTARIKDLDDYFSQFQKHFTHFEWAHINGGDPKGRLERFYRIWAMKEAFVKAIGLGLQFDLGRVQFEYTLLPGSREPEPLEPERVSARATVRVDGRLWKGWGVYQVDMGYHVLAVVTGDKCRGRNCRCSFRDMTCRRDSASHSVRIIDCHADAGEAQPWEKAEELFEMVTLADILRVAAEAGRGEAGKDVVEAGVEEQSLVDSLLDRLRCRCLCL